MGLCGGGGGKGLDFCLSARARSPDEVGEPEGLPCFVSNEDKGEDFCGRVSIEEALVVACGKISSLDEPEGGEEEPGRLPLPEEVGTEAVDKLWPLKEDEDEVIGGTVVVRACLC